MSPVPLICLRVEGPMTQTVGSPSWRGVYICRWPKCYQLIKGGNSRLGLLW